MELFTITAGFVGKNMATYFFRKGMDKVFNIQEDFEQELSKVIYNSLDEYERLYPQEDIDKQFAFYKSKKVVSELLNYRMMHEDGYSVESLFQSLDSEQNVIPPNKNQIENFYSIFLQNINSNEKLKQLEIRKTFESEIFVISKKLDSMRLHIDSALLSIKERLQETHFSHNSNEEWVAYQKILLGDVNNNMTGVSFSLKDTYIPLRAYYKDIDEIESTEKIPIKIIDINDFLEKWIFNEWLKDDSLKILVGGPGYGKSSILKMLAATLSQNGVKVLFVPLYLIDSKEHFWESMKSYFRDNRCFRKTNLDDEERLLIILDGLDEISTRKGTEAIYEFIEKVTNDINIHNQFNARLKVIISGRDIIVEHNKGFERKIQSVLHLLPYIINEERDLPCNYIISKKISENSKCKISKYVYRELLKVLHGKIPLETSMKISQEVSMKIPYYLYEKEILNFSEEFSKELLNKIYQEINKIAKEQSRDKDSKLSEKLFNEISKEMSMNFPQDTSLKSIREILYNIPHKFSEKISKQQLKLIQIDQRNLWWKQYGIISQEKQTEMPEELKREDLDEITSFPLLNYLLIMSGFWEKMDFSEIITINEIYSSLFDGVFLRKYSTGKLRSVESFNSIEFKKAMQMIAISAWHSSGGRAVSSSIIEKNAKNEIQEDNLRLLFNGINNGDLSLLISFYFRKTDSVENHDCTFEFTHLSFCEYLIACHIISILKEMTECMENSSNEICINKFRWINLFGPYPINENILFFLSNELEKLNHTNGGLLKKMQLVCVELINDYLKNGLPMEDFSSVEKSFTKMKNYARNVKWSFFIMNGIISNITFCLSKMKWQSENDFANLCHLMCHNEDIRYINFFNYIDFNSQKLNNLNLSNFNFQKSSFMQSKLCNTFLKFCCLSHVNFESADLSNADLSNADLSHSNLGNANLSNANLSNANLSNANLSNANLSNANLSNADLSNSVLHKTNFCGADLNRADLSDANLNKTNFYGANLSNACLSEAKMIEINFCEANLSNADLFVTQLIRADLRDSNLSGANLSGANLTKSNLAGAKLDLADLSEAILKDVILFENSWRSCKKTDLSGADLSGADLSGVDLRCISLQNVNLVRANLSKSNLDESNLSQVIIDNVDLSGASLNNVNLSGAKLSKINLNKAILCEAILCDIDIYETNMSEANLSKANLKGAFFFNVDLFNANLSEANLSEANLDRVNLSEANLCGADLSKIILYKTNLSGANLYKTYLREIFLKDVDLKGTILGGYLQNCVNINLED